LWGVQGGGFSKEPPWPPEALCLENLILYATKSLFNRSKYIECKRRKRMKKEMSMTNENRNGDNTAFYFLTLLLVMLVTFSFYPSKVLSFLLSIF
jgi:hypothetical protein